MALVRCKECGKEISDKASACPSCGAPMAGDSTVHVRVTRTGAKWEGLGFVLIAAGLVSMLTGNAIASMVGTLMLFVGFVVFLIGRFK